MSYYAPYRQLPSSEAALDSNSVVLTIRQQPLQACSTPDQKEKSRKAVDPPPIVQLDVKNRDDQWLVSPFLFMNALLVTPEQENGVHKPVKGKQLLGQTISSLHRLKDITNKDGGFFIFGDISCRYSGKFRLQFNLFDYEKNSGQVAFIGSTISEAFEVCAPKDFHGLMESTHLSRTFSDQGVRLRLRKEARTMTGSKRRLASTGGESTPSSTYAMYGGQVQDANAAYGAPGIKRQRSDSEYSASVYNPMQAQGNAMSGYHANLQGGGGNWTTRQHQHMTQETAAPYGMISSSQERSASIPSWHGHMQQQNPYSIRDSAGNQYYGMGAAGSRSAYAVQQQQHQQYHPRRADDPYINLSLHTPTSLPDSGLGSHQQYSMRGAGDSYAATRGLQTPSTMADDGSRQQQVYLPSSDPMARQDESGGMAQEGDYGLQGNHGQVGMRPAPTHATMQGYQSGIPAPAGSHAHPYSMQHPASAPAQYDQSQFNTQDLFHGSRDTYLPNTASMPDDSLTLDSGMLNRGYPSQFVAQQHGPDSAAEDDLSEYPKAQLFDGKPKADQKCVDCEVRERLCSKELPRCSECEARDISCIYLPTVEYRRPRPLGGTARQYIPK